MSKISFTAGNSDPHKDIDIIVPTLWKDPGFASALETYTEAENVGKIIVIDNNPQSRPPLSAKARAKLILVELNENIFVNPAWNLGVSIASASIVCLANDDIKIDGEVLRMIAQLDWQTPKIDIIGLNLGQHEQTRIQRVNISKTKPLGAQIGSFGACMFLPRENYKQIPSELKIWFGDDFLVHSNKEVYLLSTPLITGKMSTTIRSYSKDSPIHAQIRRDIGAASRLLYSSISNSEPECQAESSNLKSKFLHVVAVAHNRTGELRVFIQSWLNQSSSNWTMTVIHDGYSEVFMQTMEELTSQTPEQFTFFCTKQRYNDYGHSLREIGMQAANGDYLLLTNCDNYFIPKAVEFLEQTAQRTRQEQNADPDVVLFDMIHSHKNPGRQASPPYSLFTVEAKPYKIDVSSAIVRTKLALDVGFRDKTHDADQVYFRSVFNATPKPLVTKVNSVLFVHN